MFKFVNSKKIISVLLLIMLCISSSAFAKRELSDKARLAKAFENFADLKSYTQNLELSMRFDEDLMMQDPSFAMISSSKFILNSKVIADTQAQTGKATLNLMNQPYPFEYYISPDSFTFLSPFDERYVDVDMAEAGLNNLNESKLSASELQELERLYKSLVNKFFSSIDKDFIKSEDKIVDKKAVTEIKITLTHDDFLATLRSFMDSLSQDDDFLELAAIISSDQYGLKSEDPSDSELTPKELKAFFYNDLKNSFEVFLSEIEEKVHFDKLESTFIITRGNQIAASSYELGISEVREESKGEENPFMLPPMKLTYVIDLSFSDLNSTELDKLPKLSKEQTMTMEEFSDVFLKQFNMGYSIPEDSQVK